MEVERKERGWVRRLWCKPPPKHNAAAGNGCPWRWGHPKRPFRGCKEWEGSWACVWETAQSFPCPGGEGDACVCRKGSRLPTWVEGRCMNVFGYGSVRRSLRGGGEEKHVCIDVGSIRGFPISGGRRRMCLCIGNRSWLRPRGRERSHMRVYEESVRGFPRAGGRGRICVYVESIHPAREA